jgi:hypothetical protein
MAQIRRSTRRRGYISLAGGKHIQSRSRSIYLPLFLSLTVIQGVLLLLAGKMSAYLDAAATSGPMESRVLASDWLNNATGDDTVDLPVEDNSRKEADDTLEKASSNIDDANTGSPLHDYYSRKHMTETKRPLLIVGGSDGSGTRAFVDTLGRLGVPMLVDDSGTMDVHASTLFDGKGWPSLVELVMNNTRTANYEFEDLPAGVQEKARSELEKLKDEYEGRAIKLLAKKKQGNKRASEKVEYGFKAPISMLLLPLLLEVYGSVKFLHVVRDGRDVALSKNQSPVKKFYDIYYEDSADRRKRYDNDNLKETMGVQLWNDWNIETLEWEQRHSDGDSFDYLVMRSEDLLDQNKFDSLVQLADFVGSQKTMKELCCMSQQELVDMGKSAGHNKKTGFMHSLDEDSRSSSALKSKVSQGKTKEFTRLQESHNKRREEARYRYELNMQQPGKAVRSKRKAKVERLLEPTDSRNSRRLFGEQTLKVFKPRRNYFTEQRAQKAEEEKEEEDLMLENSTLRKKRQVDKIKKEYGTQASSHRLGTHKLTRPMSRASPEDVKKRYGKWVSALEDRPELSALLHSQGADALETFGYEPSATFMDQRRDGEFQCDATVVCSE